MPKKRKRKAQNPYQKDPTYRAFNHALKIIWLLGMAAPLNIVRRRIRLLDKAVLSIHDH